MVRVLNWRKVEEVSDKSAGGGNGGEGRRGGSRAVKMVGLGNSVGKRVKHSRRSDGLWLAGSDAALTLSSATTMKKVEPDHAQEIHKIKSGVDFTAKRLGDLRRDQDIPALQHAKLKRGGR